jgi:hypothetical protein
LIVISSLDSLGAIGIHPIQLTNCLKIKDKETNAICRNLLCLNWYALLSSSSSSRTALQMLSRLILNLGVVKGPEVYAKITGILISATRLKLWESSQVISVIQGI